MSVTLIKMAAGRPTEYNPNILKEAEEYLDSCVDDEEEKGTEDKPILSFRVKLPTIGGLARHLGVARSTLYEWKATYPEFSDIIEQLSAEQEDRLINEGLAGNYNPTISKVILTKHGYREGIDATTNDKDIPVPIINVQRNDSNTETPQAK